MVCPLAVSVLAQACLHPHLWTRVPCFALLPTSALVVSPLCVSDAEGLPLSLLLCQGSCIPTRTLPRAFSLVPRPPFSAPCLSLSLLLFLPGLWVSDPHLALMALCLELLKQCEWWGVRVGPESSRRLAAAEAPWDWRWGRGLVLDRGGSGTSCGGWEAGFLAEGVGAFLLRGFCCSCLSVWRVPRLGIPICLALHGLALCDRLWAEWGYFGAGRM